MTALPHDPIPRNTGAAGRQPPRPQATPEGARIVQRLRTRQMQRSFDAPEVSPLTAILLLPVILLILWAILSIVVSGGAAIESVLSGE